jgi:alpha-1,6-mannosyltransferase
MVHALKDLPYLALFLVSLYHVYMAPYTKVEESFQVQAVHDILYLGVGRDSLGGYDHVEFPGVVPRTYIGSLVISLLSFPWTLSSDKVVVLMVARGMLAGLVCMGFRFFGRQLGGEKAGHVEFVFVMVCMMQFHLPFYMSRMLPNICAMVLTSFGFGYWLKVLQKKDAATRDVYSTVVILTCAAIVFRCDAIILVGLVGIHMVVTQRVSLLNGIWLGIMSSVMSLMLTVLIDSYFWGRWLWPEGEVLYFNTVLNKSKEWGVMPMHWYFTSALPRMLHIAYPMAFIGALVDTRARSMMIVAVGFVLLYSLLEHKEVRFLFPTLPLWNMSAALGIYTLCFVSKTKLFLVQGIKICCLVGLAMGCALTCLSSAASYRNYPGGTGLVQLIEVARATPGISTIHIDTLAATSGVSRFLQDDAGDQIQYSKEEDIPVDDYRNRNFTYLLNEHRHIPGYTMMKEIQGFDTIDLPRIRHCITRENMRNMPGGLVSIISCLGVSDIPVVTLRLKDVLFIHKKSILDS